MQASKFSVFAAFAAIFALSGCATTAPQDSAAVGGTAGASASLAQRDLTPQEKKVIVDSVATSLRESGHGEI